MKKSQLNILKALLVVTLLVFSACELTNLNLAKNPNAVDVAEPTLQLTHIQREFGSLINNIQRRPAETVRILYMLGRVYKQTYTPSTFSGEWTNAYQGVLNNTRQLYSSAEAPSIPHHTGIARVLEAYTIITLVDLFGDIPYSEALQGLSNLNPKLDPGAEVYAAAIRLLDEAIADFTKRSTPENPIPIDLFYGGNWDNWIKAANSIKIKAYIATRLVDKDAIKKIEAIVASGAFIRENAEDFQFEWGNSNANPDTRHPNYVNNYTPSGASEYMSNWLMNYMYASKTNNGQTAFEAPDPRMKYYFYRQAAAVSTSRTLVNCAGELPPEHYTAIGAPFCSLPNGYWGRDHGDTNGTPPDQQSRTVYGVYPVGGRFDDNSFAPISSISLGAQGRGITPIMLASWVDMMRAEAALEGGAGAAATLLQSGVRKSLQKVRAFGFRDASANFTEAPDVSLDEQYVTEVGLLFNAADKNGQLDLLGSEFFVASFGNGLDAFNFYRRTGRPSKLQPNLERNPGGFFRSFYYPAISAETNANIKQKPDVTERVFWDTGTELLAN